MAWRPTTEGYDLERRLEEARKAVSEVTWTVLAGYQPWVWGAVTTLVRIVILAIVLPPLVIELPRLGQVLVILAALAWLVLEIYALRDDKIQGERKL